MEQSWAVVSLYLTGIYYLLYLTVVLIAGGQVEGGPGAVGRAGNAGDIPEDGGGVHHHLLVPHSD